MTDIINLNKQRKAKARTQKEKQAAQNRQLFGRTKQEKQRDSLTKAKAEKHIQGHKRETNNSSES